MVSWHVTRFFLTSALVLLPLLFFGSITVNSVTPAPDFVVLDNEGNTVSLSDYRGEVVFLHFTGLETPLCLECEEEMKDQLRELETLERTATNMSIITVNIRKNPYSENGKNIAEDDLK